MVQAPGANASQATQVHVARQPIVDTTGAVVAYELLFRGSAVATGSGLDQRHGGPHRQAVADAATTSTILTAFADVDPAEVLAGRRGFVNLTRAFLVGQLPVPFGPDDAVLEVLETVELDDEVVEGVRSLAAQGFTIALDDFVWSRAAEPLIELASIVKIDVLEQTWEEVLETARRCRRPGVTLLAERIEDEAMLERCRAAGFSLFQGYHLGRPETLTAQTLTPARTAALRLLARLTEPDVTALDVEALLRTEAALSFRLLRIANASSNGLRRPVGSIRDAVVVIGMEQLRSWVLLLAVAGAEGSAGSGVPALVRARACELMARRCAPETVGAAFTAGLFDGLAEMFGLGSEEFVGLLPPLAPDLTAALRGEPGLLYDLLTAVRGYERGDPAGVGPIAGADPWRAGLVRQYVAALTWAGQAAMKVEAVA